MVETPITMYRADTKQWKVVQVECPDGLYPANDADGEKIFANTHFPTAAEAWERLGAEAAAWVKMAGRDIVQAEKDLQTAQTEAGEACKKFMVYRENREAAEQE